jgi:hypothetical protein
VTPREADGVMYALRRLDPKGTRIRMVGRSADEGGSVTIVATAEGKGVVFLNWSVLADLCEKWASRGKDRARRVVDNRVARGPKLVRARVTDLPAVEGRSNG